MKVLKFGGTSVANSKALYNVIDIIKQNKNQKIVVVVSALGGITDILSEMLNKAINKGNVYKTFLNLIEEKQNIKINDIVFKERYYKYIILNFFKNNLINSFIIILKSGFLISIFFFITTILKKIKRFFSRVRNEEKLYDYIEKLEI